MLVLNGIGLNIYIYITYIYNIYIYIYVSLHSLYVLSLKVSLLSVVRILHLHQLVHVPCHRSSPIDIGHHPISGAILG